MHKLSVASMLAILGASLTLSVSDASAQTFQNLDQIDNLVSTTVGAEIGQPGGAMTPIDRRLRLAACPQIPSIEGPVFGAAIVRCDKLGWRIRIPLKLAQQAAVPGQGYGQGSYGQATYGRAPMQQPQARNLLIRKGDPVQLVAGNASFSVTRQMIADEDGAIGDMIRVHGDKASSPISGRIEPDGIVRVPGI